MLIVRGLTNCVSRSKFYVVIKMWAFFILPVCCFLLVCLLVVCKAVKKLLQDLLLLQYFFA